MSRSQETIDLLLSRRSVKPFTMVEPGPDDADLELILRAGARVPDHGKLAPWRFILFKGDTRAAFGKVLRDIYKVEEPRADESRLKIEEGRLLQAPLVVAVVSRIVPSKKAPEWEQVLSAGAACQNMLVAATALGFVGAWLTEWYAYSAKVAEALGLGENERVAGFIYFGSPSMPKDERERPALADICTEWKAG
ncbi:nitroreductase [Parvibaculum sp.]|uniref:nitroreductase family protein n=1 Tax=Parvibaculum sp. TaxID=2024848 RepID=UPI002BF8E5D1|nr:nitroreductase [Parvibaculum sp.]HUD50295.1 nitroreductase [Parvibaculum sp.]